MTNYVRQLQKHFGSIHKSLLSYIVAHISKLQIAFEILSHELHKTKHEHICHETSCDFHKFQLAEQFQALDFLSNETNFDTHIVCAGRHMNKVFTHNMYCLEKGRCKYCTNMKNISHFAYTLFRERFLILRNFINYSTHHHYKRNKLSTSYTRANICVSLSADHLI